MKKMTIAATAVAALFTACATNKTGSAEALNGEWTIERIHGTAIDKKAGEQIPFLGFDRNTKCIYGSTGCNRLTSGWKVEDGKLDTKHMGCTQMMCADMTNETLVLKALGEVEQYRIKKSTLLLTNGKGKTVMELKKK